MKAFVAVMKSGGLQLFTHEELRLAIIAREVSRVYWFPFDTPKEVTFDVWSRDVPWVSLYDGYGNNVEILKPEEEDE